MTASNDHRPRAAFVYWCPVHPVETAGAVRAHGLLPRLTRWQWTLCAPGPPPQLPCVGLPAHWLTRLPWPWSPQVFNLWGDAWRVLYDALQTAPPIALVAEGPWAARAARRAADRLGVPLLVVALNIEHRSLRSTGRRGPLRLALVKQAELRAYRLGDMLGCVSEEDRRVFVNELGFADTPTCLLPQGTDMAQLAQPGQDPRAAWGVQPDAPVLFFMGKLDYPPNADALDWLAREIAPRVLRRRPDARFVVAGAAGPRRPPAPLQYVGFVPDLAGALHTAQVCLAPLRAGTGMRTKIVDYLAAGRPVVSTTVGDSGIGLQDGAHLLRRDDADGFAEAVCALLDDPARGLALGAAGRDFVRERFDWPVIARAYEQALDRLTGRDGG